MRLVVALFALWYVALGLFQMVFPQCVSAGFGGGKVACIIGARDYGVLYDDVVMFSFLALAPLAITFVILLIVLETGLHLKRDETTGREA